MWKEGRDWSIDDTMREKYGARKLSAICFDDLEKVFDRVHWVKN